MARLSIDDDALARLRGYSNQFGTEDPSKLILLLAVERDALVRCIEAHPKPTAIAPAVTAQPVLSSGLEELSGLLD